MTTNANIKLTLKQSIGKWGSCSDLDQNYSVIEAANVVGIIITSLLYS